jgi:autotransporter-associated beta strand protein
VTGGSSPIVLNYRQFKLSYNWHTPTISNNNSSDANTLTVNSDLVVTATGNLVFRLGGSNTGANTFAGRIADGTAAVISVTKVDGGLWILSGTNTYSGTTTISGGILEISGAGVLGNGAYSGSIANSTTFRCNSTATQTLRGVISGAGVLTKGSTGTLTLSGDNTYSGATTVGGGTLICAGNSTCSGATIVTNGLLMGVVGGSCSNSTVTVTNAPGVIAAMGVSVTNNTMQWTCANLAFRTNEAVARLVFDFAEAPGTTVAPLSVTGNLTFAGMPLVVVSPSYIQPGTYPLLTVGGTAPTNEVPPLSGPSGSLYWGRTDNKTLLLTVFAKGTVIVIR